jgi:hypothetical protein
VILNFDQGAESEYPPPYATEIVLAVADLAFPRFPANPITKIQTGSRTHGCNTDGGSAEWQPRRVKKFW